MAEKQGAPFDPASYATAAQKRIRQFNDAQGELFGLVQETNRHWLDCIQDQMKLACEYASKLTTARSIPEVMTTWQEWGNREAQAMAENTAHLIGDAQNAVQKGVHLLSNGWQPEGNSLNK